MMIFNTETNLTASSLLAGQNVKTRGADNLLDGGHSEFYIRTLADYGGTPPDSSSPDLSLSNGNVAVRMAAEVIPPGVIMLWSGAIETIPEGWSLCDGTNGTPDLIGYFALGAGTSAGLGGLGDRGTISPGTYGGSEDISLGNTGATSLTIAQLPAHTHETLLDHKDNVGVPLQPGMQRVGEDGNANNALLQESSETGQGQGHTHTIDSDSGGNMPPYLALYYIMRTAPLGLAVQPLRPEGKASYLEVSGVVDLDAKFGAVTVFVVKPNADITALNIINLPEDTDSAYGAAIKIISDGASSVTFGVQFNWSNNTPPTLSSVVDSYDWIAAFTTDQGGILDAEVSIGSLD
jgi:microcystin-dependent protein